MSNRSDTVHLHSVNLDAPRLAWADCWDLLGEAERVRARRLRTRALRQRWAVARAALRSILAHYCECAPHDIEFAKGAFGKPELAGPLAKTGITFNLSHSGDTAIVAVGRDSQIGVDIEFRKPVSDWARVARRFFSPNENKQLLSLEKSGRPGAFLDCWTRKEAVIKATGEGLSAHLHDFDVSLAPCSSSAVLADYSDEQKYIDWRLTTIDLGKRFAGAVATPANRHFQFLDHGAWSFEHA